MGISLKTFGLLPVLALLVAGGAFADPQIAARMDPAAAIAAAAANPKNGAAGVFEFVVGSVGGGEARQGAIVYLNSDDDYRKPTNLTATLMPLTAKDLEKKLGGPLKEVVVGKRVVVAGTAMQTRIDMYDD